ncbi:Phage antirepressor protein KilAC domain protein [compost metagenome]
MSPLEINNTAPRNVIAENVARNVTMSSREIAELTGKEHKNVIRDIRVMLIELYGADELERIVPEKYRNRHTEYIRENAGAIMDAIFGDGSKRSHDDSRGFSWDRDTRGYVSEFRLNRTLTETLVTGYSIPLRHKVIQRLHQLEGRLQQSEPSSAFYIPRTMSEALRLAADLAEQNAGLQQVVAEQAPKVAALERLTDAGGAMCMTDAAKHLGVPRKALLAWLQANRWIYRRAGTAHWLAYQPRMAAGYLLHKVTVIGEDEQGLSRMASQVRVTSKGMAALARQLLKEA